MAQRPELDTMITATRQAGAAMLDDFAALTDPSKDIADAVAYTAAADKRAAIS